MQQLSHRGAFGLIMVGVLLCVSVSPTEAEELTLEAFEGELWYVVLVEGERAGHMNVSFEVDREAGTATTRSSARMRFRRGQTPVTFEIDGHLVETLEGQPVSGHSRVKVGAFAVEQRFEYGPEGIEVITRQLDQEQKQTLPPIEGEFLTPGQASLRFTEAVRAGRDHFTYRMLDPTAGSQPHEVGFRRIGEKSVEVFGKTVPATEWEVSDSISPQKMRQFLDEQGNAVKMTLAVMPGMNFEMLLADRDIARAEVDPPELMASTLIHPEKKIAAPRSARRVVYELSVLEGIDPEQITVPEAGYQRIEEMEKGRWRVTVDTATPQIERTPELEPYLASSNLINHDHPHVSEAMPENLDPVLAPRELALRLNEHVFDYLEQKDLSVGMASAAETAKTRVGDCTEHAFLLAALLRRADIPSRTVTGLIYVDGFLGERDVLGYHMWTQAWIAHGQNTGYWLDLDPTMPSTAHEAEDDAPPAGFDAAHLALFVSSVDKATVIGNLLDVSKLIGSLDVEIAETK